jgi:hypothetical protein
VALLTRTDQQQTNSAALLAATQWRIDRQMRARTKLNEETGNKGEAIAMVEIVRNKQQAVIARIPEDDSKAV